MKEKIAQEGDKVKLHYTGKLQDGTIFDSSINNKPLEVYVGRGELITGFENAIIGMKEGDIKSITISPQEGYGMHDPRLIKDVERKYLPKNINPKIGMQFQLGEQENTTIVTIIDVTSSHIKLDANHPLAGITLLFDIEIIKIE